MDKKTIIIWILAGFIVILLAYIGYSELKEGINEKMESAYIQGAQYGQLLEQKNALMQIQQQGVYIIEVIDQSNKTQQVMLGLVQPAKK